MSSPASITPPSPLLLAGGKSTRMGSPKHLLPMPDGRPLYQHHLDILRKVSGSHRVFISLARDSVLDTTLQEATSGQDEDGKHGIHVIRDLQENETDTSAGPAAGLLAAHSLYPAVTWLVLACDYPFVTTEALRHLQSSYVPPVTCFFNGEGFCESLIGIWSPEALAHLARRHAEGCSGPSRTVKELGGMVIPPPEGEDLLLCNVNTEAEWNAALEKMKKTDVLSDLS